MEIKQVEKVSTLIFPNTLLCVQISSKSLVQRGFILEIAIRNRNKLIKRDRIYLRVDLEWIREKHNKLIDFYVFLGGIIIN